MKATNEVAALEKKLDGEIKRLGEKNIAELIDSGAELEEEDFLEDDFDDDDVYIAPPSLLGKIEVFCNGGFRALDIKIDERVSELSFALYELVIPNDFLYLGEFDGYHRYAPERFTAQPAAFQEQYLGWMIMEIQAAAMHVLESGDFIFDGDSFVRTKNIQIS